MFQLTKDEAAVLRSQIAISNSGFVEMRRAVAGYSALEKRLDQLERDTGSRLGQQNTVRLADI